MNNSRTEKIHDFPLLTFWNEIDIMSVLHEKRQESVEKQWNKNLDFQTPPILWFCSNFKPKFSNGGNYMHNRNFWKILIMCLLPLNSLSVKLWSQWNLCSGLVQNIFTFWTSNASMILHLKDADSGLQIFFCDFKCLHETSSSYAVSF